MSAQRPFDLPGYKTRVVGRVAPDGSCIIAAVGDKRTLCGQKTADVGYCWAKFVQAHIDGHNPPWCERCLYLWAQP